MAVQAKRELVESYKRLRTEDAAPGSSTSYRCPLSRRFPCLTLCQDRHLPSAGSLPEHFLVPGSKVQLLLMHRAANLETYS